MIPSLISPEVGRYVTTLTTVGAAVEKLQKVDQHHEALANDPGPPNKKQNQLVRVSPERRYVFPVLLTSWEEALGISSLRFKQIVNDC